MECIRCIEYVDGVQVYLPTWRPKVREDVGGGQEGVCFAKQSLASLAVDFGIIRVNLLTSAKLLLVIKGSGLSYSHVVSDSFDLATTFLNTSTPIPRNPNDFLLLSLLPRAQPRSGYHPPSNRSTDPRIIFARHSALEPA